MIALGELSHGLAGHSLICAVWGVGSRGLAVARSGSRDCAPSQRPARQFANTLMHVSDRWQAGTREYRAASGSNQVSMRSSDNIAGTLAAAPAEVAHHVALEVIGGGNLDGHDRL